MTGKNIGTVLGDLLALWISLDDNGKQAWVQVLSRNW
jgi:hypothetical protein